MFYLSENQKEKAMLNAKASLRMEGMKTSPQLEDARRMVLEGKITHKEYVETVRRFVMEKE